MQRSIPNPLTKLRLDRWFPSFRHEPVKSWLAIGTVLTLIVMWFQHGIVSDAYVEEHEGATLNLSGIDLTVDKTDVGPSPYIFDRAPDTGSEPVSLAFAENPSDKKVELLGGEATIAGTVSDGTHVVPGARVRIERHTSAGSAFRDVRVSDSGRWSISGVLGGRYRVRAWVPGSHTMDQSVVFFAEDAARQSIDLTIREVVSKISLQSFSPVQIFEEGTGTFTLGVTELSVDSEGFSVVGSVQGVPLNVSVQSPGRLLSAGSTVSNGRGEAYFRVTCEGLGTVRARVEVDGSFKWVDVAQCRPVPPPTTQPPVETTIPEATTTTKPAETEDED